MDSKRLENSNFPRRLAAAILLLLLAANPAAWGQELRYPSDARLRKLGSIYPEDAPSQVALACSQRSFGAQQDWDTATAEWRRRNAPALAEATRLQGAVSTALRKSRPPSIDIDTWAFVVYARFEASAQTEQLLATLGDVQAKAYCEETLSTRFGAFTVDMSDGRAAASAVAEDLNGPAH